MSPIPLTFYLVVSFVAGIGLALICGAGLYGVHKLVVMLYSLVRSPFCPTVLTFQFYYSVNLYNIGLTFLTTLKFKQHLFCL